MSSTMISHFKELNDERIRESKFKVGDIVNAGHNTFEGGRVTYDCPLTVTEVIYDLKLHTADSHVYVTRDQDNEPGLWFESELMLRNRKYRIRELADKAANEIADQFSPGFFDDRMVNDVAKIIYNHFKGE